jgi:hypothetical protein
MQQQLELIGCCCCWLVDRLLLWKGMKMERRLKATKVSSWTTHAYLLLLMLLLPQIDVIGAADLL